MWIENDKFEIVTKAGLRGELMYKGPNVAWGYSHNYNDLSAAKRGSDILRTGDIAYFDKEGFFI